MGLIAHYQIRVGAGCWVFGGGRGCPGGKGPWEGGAGLAPEPAPNPVEHSPNPNPPTPNPKHALHVRELGLMQVERQDDTGGACAGAAHAGVACCARMGMHGMVVNDSLPNLTPNHLRNVGEPRRARVLAHRR